MAQIVATIVALAVMVTQWPAGIEAVRRQGDRFSQWLGEGRDGDQPQGNAPFRFGLTEWMDDDRVNYGMLFILLLWTMIKLRAWVDSLQEADAEYEPVSDSDTGTDSDSN
ncbi:hypothetical protein HDE_03804 [Halotydeus destructor]|nr:hypothetical protein HDE_03804 [Halotydeus destructor]